MKDYELAKAFFDRIKEKGFNVRYEDFNGNEIGSEFYDPEQFQSIELGGAEGRFFSIGFYPDGCFFRISGFISGFWADEVDWAKY